ncbi:hypothetical protein K0C01_12160 [Salinarchaeum sp. IM2453]|uniref:hypothetical protein n=1 Tax=Salinarchaeum sp. IM2453 TaxID=2862870 RepID=UPI001C832D59|nr:hypothetical protein [Salinarchaeum sp. IM2453]QZA88517.1 hypothetical protein K0C01_12160 [Salinarchaeum sp. IM2453]
MKRRNFIAGGSSLALGGAFLVASGAFTRVDAEREAVIQINDDPDAIMGLEPCTGSPNGEFAQITDDNTVAISLSETTVTDPGGRGVNPGAKSQFDRVFEICNQETQDHQVWIRDEENWPVDEETGERRVDFYLADNPDRSIVGEENAVELLLGECICVGVETVTFGLSAGEQLLEELDNQIWIEKDGTTE